jgi:hypothetical protein
MEPLACTNLTRSNASAKMVTWAKLATDLAKTFTEVAISGKNKINANLNDQRLGGSISTARIRAVSASLTIQHSI